MQSGNLTALRRDLFTWHTKPQGTQHTHTHTTYTYTYTTYSLTHTLLWVKLKTRFVYFSIINYALVIRFDSVLQKYLCHQHHPSRWRTPPSSPGRVSIVSDKLELTRNRWRGWMGQEGGRDRAQVDWKWCSFLCLAHAERALHKLWKSHRQTDTYSHPHTYTHRHKLCVCGGIQDTASHKQNCESSS